MKYKKMISLMLALGISMCFVGCGDADGSANTGTAENSLIDATVTETVAVQTDSISQTDFSTPETTTVSEETTTEEETTTTQEEKSQPKKPTYKYPTMSEGNLGSTEEFVSDLQDKLTLLLGDDYIFYLEDVTTEENDDAAYTYMKYKFKCSDKVILEGQFSLSEDTRNPGYLVSVYAYMEGGIWDTPHDNYTGEIPICDITSKRIFKTSVCVLLSPLAVWENYSTEEEILSRFYEYDDRDDVWEDYHYFSPENTGAKIKAKLLKSSGYSDWFDSEVGLYINDDGSGSGFSSASWVVPVVKAWEMD